MKTASIGDLQPRILTENALAKRPQLRPLVVFGQTRQLPSLSHYHGKSSITRFGWIVSLFESMLS